MKKLVLFTVSAIAFASTGVFSNAFAQEKTRAEVRQELIQAENNGSRFVTDTSYPAVDPIYAAQVARLKQSHADMGTDTSGSSASGMRMSMHSRDGNQSCVGPADFCTPFFGS